MPFLRLFFGEAAHSQPCDPAFCCCFGVILGCFLLQRGDANPTWFGLTCGTDRGIQFWGKSTQGFSSSFSLFIPSKAVVMVWALQWCCCSCRLWVCHQDLQPQGFWCVKFCMESVMGSWGSSQCSSSFPVLVCKGSFPTHPSILQSLGWKPDWAAAFSGLTYLWKELFLLPVGRAEV